MGGNPKYEKAYDLPYPEAVEYPYERMSMAERAAQFSPFRALTGYEDAVEEAARLTDAKIELEDSAADLLNAKMQILQDHIGEQPEIQVTYFVPDQRKAGGRYVTVSGRAERINSYERTLRFADKRAIPMDDILAMDGAVFGASDRSETEWD